MLAVLNVVTLILAAVTMALSLAHALELPGKMRLTREQYLAVQPIYYPGFTYAGACEPLTIVAIGAVLALTPIESRGFWLVAGALLAAALTHALYWWLTAPINKTWLKGEKLGSGAQRFFGADIAARSTDNWMDLRDRWERSHVYRAATAMTAFVLLTIASAIEKIAKNFLQPIGI